MAERVIFILVILILGGTVPEWKPLVIKAYQYAMADDPPPAPAPKVTREAEAVRAPLPTPPPTPAYREEEPSYSYAEESARIRKILEDRRIARERAAKARKKKRCVRRETFPRLEFHERPRGFEIGIRFR